MTTIIGITLAALVIVGLVIMLLDPKPFRCQDCGYTYADDEDKSVCPNCGK